MSPGFRRAALRAWVVAGLGAGIALTIWIIRRAGASIDIPLLAASWPVLLAAACWFVLPLLAAAQSWRRLFPPRRLPPLAPAVAFTWIGFGVNWLLPVAMVGGEVVKFRLGWRAGWHASSLAAALVVDKTLQVATQIVYLLLAAGLLLAMTGRADWSFSGFVWLTGLVVAAGLFYRAQNAGLFSGLAASFARVTGGRARAGLRMRQIDAATRRVYKRRGDLLRAAALRMLFRVLMAGEILLALLWLDAQSTSICYWIAAAIVLESFTQLARGAAFFIPAGLGAQEGALIGTGMLLGIPAQTLLLAALTKRTRELLVGGSALITWQFSELRWLSQRAG